MASTHDDTARVIARPTGDRMRVAIVDEYPGQVEGVARVIGQAASMEVVMTATSGHDALDMIDDAHPDVVVMEPWMRAGDGVEFAVRMAQEHPEITLIALSRLWDEDHVGESMGVGMAAHLPKTTPLDDLPALIRQAVNGAEVRPANSRMPAMRTPLTTRERDVLRLAARGMSNAEIGRDLYVTEQTVKFHLSNIYRKLGVANRTQASHEATRAGILG